MVKHWFKRINKGTTPVDGGNFEKVLDILVKHPQLVKNLNELADELRTFYSKLAWKIQYFMHLGDIDFMFLINCLGDSIVAKAVALATMLFLRCGFESHSRPNFFAFLQKFLYF